MTTQRFLSQLDADLIELIDLETEVKMAPKGSLLAPLQQMKFAEVVNRWETLIDLSDVMVGLGDPAVQISKARAAIVDWRDSSGSDLLSATVKSLLGTGGSLVTANDSMLAVDAAAKNYDPDLSSAGTQAQKLWSTVLSLFPKIGSRTPYGGSAATDSYYDAVMAQLALFRRHYGPKSRATPRETTISVPGARGLFVFGGTATWAERNYGWLATGAGTFTLTARQRITFHGSMPQNFSLRGVAYLGGVIYQITMRPGDVLTSSVNAAINDQMQFNDILADLPAGAVLVTDINDALGTANSVEDLIGLYSAMTNIGYTDCLLVAKRYARYLREEGIGDVTMWMAKVFRKLRGSDVANNQTPLDTDAQITAFLTGTHYYPAGGRLKGVPLSDFDAFFSLGVWIDNSNIYDPAGPNGYYSISMKRLLYRNWYALINFLVIMAASDGRFSDWDQSRD